MAKTAQIIVAKAELGEEVHVDENAPDAIRIAPGTTLYVKFPFHYVEASADKERYRFVLTAAAGDQTPEPATATWHDRPGIKDELQGTIQQQFRFETVGEHDLVFRAEAQYRTEPWSGDGEESETTVGVEGSVRVMVE